MNNCLNIMVQTDILFSICIEGLYGISTRRLDGRDCGSYITAIIK
jgi:hypothetical protein